MAQGAAVKRKIAALALLLAWPCAAGAKPQTWPIDGAESRLGIVYRINGDERRGKITRFAGYARFDPVDLTTAELALVIEMDNVDVGEPFGAMIVKTSDWFDLRPPPSALYAGPDRTPGRSTLPGGWPAGDARCGASGDG